MMQLFGFFLPPKKVGGREGNLALLGLPQKVGGEAARFHIQEGVNYISHLV